jgi:pyruvate dehydrogenase E1 component
VILAKTVKGYGMGKAGEGKNTVHQTKKLTTSTCARSATASASRSPTSELAQLPFYKPAEDTPEMRYLHERRKALGGYLPKRRARPTSSSPSHR